MSLAIQWNQDFCTGSPGIDQYQRQLFELLQQLDNAIENDEQAALPMLIEGLTAESINLNAYEEALLLQAGYPDLPSHRQQHQAFEQRMHQHLLALHRGESPLRIARALRTALTLWLRNHVRHAGRDYGSCLQRHRNLQKLPKVLRQMFSPAG